MADVRRAKLTDLLPDDQNANTGTERGLRVHDDSVRKYGAGRPILVDANGKVIAGNKTLERLVDAGFEDVIIVPFDGKTLIAGQRTDLDLDDPQGLARGLAIADNRVGELNLNWSAEQLFEHVQDGVDFEGVFRDDELAEMFNEFIGDGDVEEVEAEDPDAADFGDVRPMRGDVWLVESKSQPGTVHRVMCGDSTDAGDVARLMGGTEAEADAVVTDPPYGINREGIINDKPETLRELFDGALAIMPIQNAVVIAFQSPRLFYVWLDAVRSAGHKFERLLWMYKPNDETFPWRGWLLKSEAILVSSLGKGQWQDVHPYSHDVYSPTTLGTELEGINGNHASVKPLPVIVDLLQRVCKRTVYDPFLGSGTTLIAAEQLGRTCYGCEIAPRYVEVILRRAEQMGLTAHKEDNS